LGRGIVLLHATGGANLTRNPPEGQRFCSAAFWPSLCNQRDAQETHD
jgi:hypothetical protein